MSQEGTCANKGFLKSFNAHSDLFHQIIFTAGSLYTLEMRPGEPKFCDARSRLAPGTMVWFPAPSLAAGGWGVEVGVGGVGGYETLP